MKVGALKPLYECSAANSVACAPFAERDISFSYPNRIGPEKRCSWNVGIGQKPVTDKRCQLNRSMQHQLIG